MELRFDDEAMRMFGGKPPNVGGDEKMPKPIRTWDEMVIFCCLSSLDHLLHFVYKPKEFGGLTMTNKY